MDDDAPAEPDRPLLLTPAMRAEPEDDGRTARRAERLAALQAVVGQMEPLAADSRRRPARAPLSPEPAGVDPETVRAMLREIVREELAGKAGERITSHLRRLVREEVEQALIRREFDLRR